jgi:hypothetical protein
VAEAYQITAQHQSVSVGAAGELIDVMNVTFTTAERRQRTGDRASGRTTPPRTSPGSSAERAAILEDVAAL